MQRELGMEQKSEARQEQIVEQVTKSNKKINVWLLPIWLRLVIIIALMVIMVIIGAVIGYSVIGGGHLIDVFKPSTWTHIVDIVNAGT